MDVQKDPSRAVVLVVDDDEDHAFVLALTLRSLGYDVLTAGSCHEAVAAIHAGHIDALVTDLSLGDGTALDVLREVGARRPRVAIVLTGFDLQDVGEEARRAFDYCLVKPQTGEAIDRVLREQLRRRDVA